MRSRGSPGCERLVAPVAGRRQRPLALTVLVHSCHLSGVMVTFELEYNHLKPSSLGGGYLSIWTQSKHVVQEGGDLKLVCFRSGHHSWLMYSWM
jgi:hypothetical protein